MASGRRCEARSTTEMALVRIRRHAFWRPSCLGRGETIGITCAKTGSHPDDIATDTVGDGA